MKHPTPASLFVFLLVFFISACIPFTALDNSKTSAASPNGIPTAYIPTGVHCFFTYYDPFAFMPDSLLMLVRASSGVQVFDLASMKEDQYLSAATMLDGPSVALSPDGNMLAWALEGGAIPLNRLPNFKKMAVIHSQQDGSLKLAFAPTGDKLYSASHNEGIDVWDLHGNLLASFDPHAELMSFALSPDGSKIATIPSEGPVSIWSTRDFGLVSELGGTGGLDTSEATFSPDGKLLAADLATGLHMWNLSDGRELISTADAITSMAVTFSPDGRYLAYANVKQVILASEDGSQIMRTLIGHQFAVFRLLFSPDSSILVSADDVDIRIWRVEDGQLLAVGSNTCR